IPSGPNETWPAPSTVRPPSSRSSRSTRTCSLPAAAQTRVPRARAHAPAREAVVDRVREEEVVVGVKGVVRVHVALDRQVHDVDSRVGASGDEAREDPRREPAEPGRENLVGADAHARGDAVGGEAVGGAGDSARDPGAVALEVAVAAVAQAAPVDDAEAEKGLQVIAGDEVAAQRGIEHAADLAGVGPEPG